MPDTQNANYGGDDDSLFGSPPPSASPGRSPSPLAFPSGTAQNVGTLALPGSHLVAELPVPPPASLPLSASVPVLPQSPLFRAQPITSGSQPRDPLQPIGLSFRRNSPGISRVRRTDAGLRRPRKSKEKEKSNPRPAPPPISLPSPNEPLPPNFLRNQQALLGLAGMVGGINPANLSKARHTRGMSAENPIVVEDEPAVSQPTIGRKLLRIGPSNPSHLPRPTSEQILASLLQEKNILPVLVSLLRLLVPEAPSLVTTPPPNHSHTPSLSPSPSASSQIRSQSPEQTTGSTTSSNTSAPPLKRRKLNSVPAGATDWDVPYPFRDGQGPQNYRNAWERNRGKQVVTDLIQLVRRAAEKAATKAWYKQQQQLQQRLAYGATTMKYYRPATLYYGLERSTAAQLNQSGPQMVADVQARSGSGTATFPTSVAQDLGLRLPHVSSSQTTSPHPSLSSEAFAQLVMESLVEAHRPTPSATPAHAADMPPSPMTLTSEESTQAFFDNWLEMLTTFPPGDPNDGGIGSPAPDTTALSSMAVEPPVPIPDALIDPSLLAMAIDQTNHPRPSSSYTTGHVDESFPVDLVASSIFSTVPTGTAEMATERPPTMPTSPSMTVTSLTESAEAGPPTPSLDWALPDTVAGKAMDALVEMDLGVDFDTIMRAWQGLTPDASTPTDGVHEISPGVSYAPSPLRAEPQTTGDARLPGDPPSAGVVRPLDVAQLANPVSRPQSPMMVYPYAAPMGPPSFPYISPPVQPSVVLSPTPPPMPVADPVMLSARAKGKGKAIPGTGNGIGSASSSTGKQGRRAVLEKARAMRAALGAEVERAKIALWETTLEQGVLVGLGRELEKGKEG